MKKSTLLIIAVGIISFATSCAKGSGCYYNTSDTDQEIQQEKKTSSYKFNKE